MSMKSSPRKFFLIAAVVCSALTALLIWYLGGRLHPYPMWIACTSVATFLFYGFDKLQSLWDGWRVPELVLHLLALAGGFPGGFLGRFLFRHKTRKALFLIVLIAAALIHAALFFYIRPRIF